MAILIEKIVFGIVLYNQKLEESPTFNTLLASFDKHNDKHNEKNKKLSILIFDNTPRSDGKFISSVFWKNNNRCRIKYITEGENKGLPYAYNIFAYDSNKESKEWLVLLDQDTDLPNDFIETYVKSDPKLNLHCPWVFSNNTLISPSHYRLYRSYIMDKPKHGNLDLEEVTCINSGFMINVKFFIQHGGYNDRLFLDFCDHDFLLRVKSSEKKIGIIPVTLFQDFSAVEHTKKQALKRYNLFLKDLKVFYKNKNAFHVFSRVDLPRLLKLSYRFKTFAFLKSRLF